MNLKEYNLHAYIKTPLLHNFYRLWINSHEYRVKTPIE